MSFNSRDDSSSSNKNISVRAQLFHPVPQDNFLNIPSWIWNITRAEIMRWYITFLSSVIHLDLRLVYIFTPALRGNNCIGWSENLFLNMSKSSADYQTAWVHRICSNLQRTHANVTERDWREGVAGIGYQKPPCDRIHPSKPESTSFLRACGLLFSVWIDVITVDTTNWWQSWRRIHHSLSVLSAKFRTRVQNRRGSSTWRRKWRAEHFWPVVCTGSKIDKWNSNSNHCQR